MSTRKYRLAAPMDVGTSSVSHLPIPSLIRPLLPRSVRFDDVERRTRKTFLENTEKVEETKSFTPPARWWLVLPSLIVTILVNAADPLLMNDLIVRRYERRYGFDASSNAQRTACRQSTTTPPMPFFYWQFPPPNQMPQPNRPDYNIVQRDAANFHTKASIITLVPALFTFVILGANCDIIGRRPLLILPLIGKIIWCSLMLIIVLRDLSDAWLLAVHAIEGLFGSIGLVMLSAIAYITDCTDGPMRTRAFLLAEGIAFLARIVPILAVGIWLRFYQYTVPLSVFLGLTVIGLFYTLFVQPESVESVRNMSFLRQMARIRLKPIIGTVTVFTRKRLGSKRQNLALITITMILLQVVLLGYFSVFSLYLYGRPLCLDALPVSLIGTAQAVVAFLLSVFTALCKRSFDKTYWAAILGSLAVIANLIILSVAKKIWLLYIAACIGSFFFITMPVLRTKLTAMIEVNEYATVFIGAGIIETLGYSVVRAVANTIYNASINFFPGLIFLLFAATGVLPIIIMCYLVFLEKRSHKNIDTITASMTDRTKS